MRANGSLKTSQSIHTASSSAGGRHCVVDVCGRQIGGRVRSDAVPRRRRRAGTRTLHKSSATYRPSKRPSTSKKGGEDDSCIDKRTIKFPTTPQR